MAFFEKLSSIPIDEATLRDARDQMNSIIPKHVPREDEDTLYVQLKTVLEALIHTANHADVTSHHRTAICNPLCMFLERCQLSENERIKQLSTSDGVCLRLLDIFIDRFNHAKASPMRQLLLVVLGIFLKNATVEDLRKEKMIFLNKILSNVIEHNDHQKVKPSMQALTTVLQKNVISYEDFMQAFISLSKENRRRDSDIFGDEANDLQRFIEMMMGWIPFLDISQSASNLISAIISKAYRSTHKSSEETSHPNWPVWAPPLLKHVAKSPTTLSIYKRFLFPVIFPKDLEGFNQFVCGLGRENIELTLPTNGPKEHQDLTGMVLLSCLQSGKELGLIEDMDSPSTKFVSFQKGVIRLSEAFLGPLLSHPNPAIRISAFAVVVSSSHITRPIGSSGLKLLRLNLPHFLADTDANTRSEANGLTQRLVDRMRAITMSQSKAIVRIKNYLDGMKTGPLDTSVHDKACLVLREHEKFLDWFIKHICLGLRPSATYQRTISSLKSLLILVQSGLEKDVDQMNLSRQAQREMKWPFNRTLFTATVVRAVQDLLLHPYDDIRQAAEQVLELSKVSLDLHQSEGTQLADTADGHPNDKSVISRATKRMLQTGRADHADGLARMQVLCWRNSVAATPEPLDDSKKPQHRHQKLDLLRSLINQALENIGVAKVDMALAVQRHPLHGVLGSLRYIVEQPDFLKISSKSHNTELFDDLSPFKKIFRLYFNVWECVKDILCNDAPEGHIPEDLEEAEDIGTKDILSYSWRAMKEASLLLKAIIKSLSARGRNDETLLSIAELGEVGNTCFVQLSEIRHRGAFSVVALTFAAFCTYCSNSKDIQVRNIIENLYEETQSCIQEKATVLTRRSGGIPSILSGLLCANPYSHLFSRAIDDLRREASSDTKTRSNISEARLPQVHALNCLKEIFTNSKLNDVSEPFISKTLILAADKLESSSWTIRNCGSMLFRALINRLLGSETYCSSAGKSSSLLSYDQFPDLLDVVFKLLDSGSKMEPADGSLAAADDTDPYIVTESVFPALQILQRSTPPLHAFEKLRRRLLFLVSSSQWHVRDIAARSYAAMTSHIKIVLLFSVLLDCDASNQNNLHGRLLCARYVLQVRFQDVPSNSEEKLADIRAVIRSKTEAMLVTNRCPVTRAAFVDVLFLVQKKVLLGAVSNMQPLSDNGYLSDCSAENAFWEEHSFDHQTLLQDYFMQLSRIKTGEQVTSRQAEAGGLLRVSLVNYLICSYAIQDFAPTKHTVEEGSTSESCQRLLLDLARSDPDACVKSIGIFAEIRELTQYNVSIPFLEFEARVLLEVFPLQDDVEVCAGILSELANILEIYSERPNLKMPIWLREGLKELDIIKFLNFVGSPSLEQSLQQLEGYTLDLKVRDDGWCPQTVMEFGNYIARLRQSLSENKSYTSRYAAVKGLHGLQHILCSIQKTNNRDNHIFQCCLLVYDVLNDDDEDIRKIAAEISTRVILDWKADVQVCSSGYVPLVASELLLKRMGELFSGSPEFFCEALVRVTGVANFKPVNAASFDLRQMILAARKEDDALFVQEKQNLYIDNYREVVLWTNILQEMTPSLASNEAEFLCDFVCSGFSCLIEMAKEQYDGPLGWTSKPEVFIIIMQVLQGSRVLLRWRTKPTNIPVTGSRVRGLLIEFIEAGEASEMHPLLTGRANSILSGSVSTRLKVIGRGVRQILSALDS